MGIYTLSKSARWPSGKGQNCPSGRPGGRRSTVIIMTVGPPVDRSVDRRLKTESRALCRSTGRSTVQRALLSGNGPGRPAGRPAESSCSLYPVPIDRAVDRWHNGYKNDRWPVDRVVDRKGNSALCQTANGQILVGYKYPSS